jgi:malonate-semialdehyde dehydrogenase (acetylating)/methylmalonate-semialdehyde dehydrogenase
VSAPQPQATPLRTIAHWIGGRHHVPAGGRLATLNNPATGEAAAQLSMAGSAEVAAAVAAAKAAFPAWRDTPPLRRARVLFRFRDLVDQHRAELARLITAEHGKTLSDADGSIQRGLEVVEFACGIPHLLQGESARDVGTGVDTLSVREPLGVCVGITPFNFPAMVPLWMMPLAIACGNAFILKPSDKTPSCGLRLAELLADAGLPAGVCNVLHGDAETVNALLTHPDVAAVSFVGSTPVAQHIYRTAAAGGKRVQALGGAKNHLVVMPDADMEQAAEALVGAAFGSAGERCMAISVAVAVGDAGDRLRAALLPRINKLRLGPGDQPGVDIGPLVTAEHRDRVAGYIAAGVAEGAELVVDGRAASRGAGFFLGPSLFDHATTSMRIWREEIFGPVLTMTRAPTLSAALALVNAHAYGNGAAIYTRDGGAAREFTAGVEAGMVGVNVAIPVPVAFFSFGGRRQSMFGDSNMHGVEGVRFYTRLKTVTLRWPDGGSAAGGLDMPTLK